MSIPNSKYTAFLRKWKQEIEILGLVINDRWIHYPGFSAIPAPKILSNNHKYLSVSCCSICNFERQRSLKTGQKWQFIKPSFPRTSAVSSSDWGLVEGWRNWSDFKKSPLSEGTEHLSLENAHLSQIPKGCGIWKHLPHRWRVPNTIQLFLENNWLRFKKNCVWF